MNLTFNTKNYKGNKFNLVYKVLFKCKNENSKKINKFKIKSFF